MAIEFKVGGKTYQLSDTLRVVFELKNFTGAKNMREALASIAHLDLDGQLKLLYVAYKTSKPVDLMPEEDFTNILIDNYGLYAITDLVEQLANGLMFSGLDKEKAEQKKLQMEETLKNVPGAISSDTDIE